VIRAALMGALIALCLTGVWGASLAHAQTTDSPASATASQSGGNAAPAAPTPAQVLLPDPRELVRDVFNQAMVDLLQGISDALRRVIAGVMGSSLNVITQTPPGASYDNTMVRSLWNTVRGIANAALALVTLWGGFNLIAREQLGAPYHDAMELFPRLALGFLLVNTSLSWVQLVIDANNVLCQAIGQAALPGWQGADASSQVLANVIAVLIYLVTSLILLIQCLMRLALIDVLLMVAPLALLCWILPQTQSWARLWSSTFFSAVATQFVQVLALRLGGSLMTDLTPMASDAALLAVFLGIALLALTLKIPSLMRAHLNDGLGFARYFAYRAVARNIEGG
jgi:hypothetical protein